MLDLNLVAAIDWLGAALPLLGDAGRRHGRAFVVLVASLSGVRATPGFPVYSATKAALRSLATSLNDDHAADGLRACALCPGYVDTPLTEWVRQQVEAGSMLQPGDLGRAVELLLDLSPNAVLDELVLRRAGAAAGQP
jgi:NAD(P)-dependent dehydrogenase (short-subunit alcohol dehydrogenase family)